MNGWSRIERQWWAGIAESIQKPWPVEAVHMDLRWWASLELTGEATRPGRPRLMARWGWAERRTRTVIASSAWIDPIQKGPAKVQEGSSEGPASRARTLLATNTSTNTKTDLPPKPPRGAHPDLRQSWTRFVAFRDSLDLNAGSAGFDVYGARWKKCLQTAGEDRIFLLCEYVYLGDDPWARETIRTPAKLLNYMLCHTKVLERAGPAISWAERGRPYGAPPGSANGKPSKFRREMATIQNLINREEDHANPEVSPAVFPAPSNGGGEGWA